MDVIFSFGFLILFPSIASKKDNTLPPVITEPPGGFGILGYSIAENSNVSYQHIITVETKTVHDIVYQLLNDTGINHNHLVDIDEASGRITFKASADIDYETAMATQNNLIIVFMAVEERDENAPRSATGTVLIGVEDVNDVVPSFDADTRIAKGFDIDNNTEQDTVVGRVKAIDSDGTAPNNHIASYGIMDIYSPFLISSGGRIRVRHGQTINASERDVWNITITAIDNGEPRLTGSTTTIIRVRSSTSSGVGVFEEYRAKLMTSSLAVIYFINQLR